jgi:hypothetical protein
MSLTEALKALMVIPRTPEPEPAPRDPYSLLTEEQRRKLDAIAESMVTVRLLLVPGVSSANMFLLTKYTGHVFQGRLHDQERGSWRPEVFYMF